MAGEDVVSVLTIPLRHAELSSDYLPKRQKKCPQLRAWVLGVRERLLIGFFVFFVAQRHNQHIDVYGVNQLTGGRH